MMKELTINISKDFSKYIGGREKKIAEFSGEDFRERFLEANIDRYDKINIELDGVFGYPLDFLDEVFGVMARKLGREKFWQKFKLVSVNNYAMDKIVYIVNHSKKDE